MLTTASPTMDTERVAQLAARVAELEADRQFHDDLHRDMVGGSLQHIVSTLARHLQGAVVFQNASLVALAEAGKDAGEIPLTPALLATVLDGGAPLSSGCAVVELPPASPTPRRFVAPVRNGQVLLGCLTAAAPVADERHVGRALESAARVVALERLVRSEGRRAQWVEREALLEDLLAGGSSPRFVDRALLVDVDLRRPHVVCVFTGVPPSGAAARPLARLVREARYGVAASSSEVLSVVRGDIVAALVPEDGRGCAAALCQQVVSAAAEMSFVAVAGVSPVCRDVADYPGALRKARFVTEALPQMGATSWATFDALGLYAILFGSDHPSALDDFVEHRLGPLIRHDEIHRSDLVATLQAVLETGGVMTAAAKRLYVHISTLKYRAKRIEEVLDVDLRNPQTSFELHLASKMLWVSRRRA